ncbi:MAG: hypothetical protein ACLSVD_02675 [Eggerthellaceae bacterium]
MQTKLGLTTDRKEFITSTWAITNGVQGRMSSYGLRFDNSGPYVNWLEKIFNEKGYRSSLPHRSITRSRTTAWTCRARARCGRRSPR